MGLGINNSVGSTGSLVFKGLGLWVLGLGFITSVGSTGNGVSGKENGNYYVVYWGYEVMNRDNGKENGNYVTCMASIVAQGSIPLSKSNTLLYHLHGHDGIARRSV